MAEKNQGEPNLLSVRKIAIMSMLEVFKDIIPEYRIGQIDLKTQQGERERESEHINSSPRDKE